MGWTRPPCSEPRHGIYWLELLVGVTSHCNVGRAFEAARPHSASVLQRVPTVREQLNLFKKSVLATVRDYLHPESRELVKPVAKPMPRFKQLGLCSSVACLPFFPAWDAARRREVMLSVFRLHTAYKTSWPQDLASGRLLVSMQAIHFDASAPWARTRGPPPAPAPEGIFKFACPGKCGQVLATAGRPVPTPAGEWPKVPCSKCACSRRVDKAQCVACSLQLRLCKCSPEDQVREARAAPDVRAMLGIRIAR